ncbi:MAG: MFS transporter, partial [Chloroflexi bacterium]
MSSPATTSQSYEPPADGFRTFVILWISQTISVMGSALTVFSVTIWLAEVLYPNPEQKAQLAFALSATGIVWGVTHILITPFAGAWADRHDRKETMIICDLLNTVLSLTLVILMLSGALELWLLLVIMALATVVSDFHGAAFDTSYAMLVPESQLARANGMMQTSWALSSIISPAIAAMLIALPALA